jgi:hypothetical protein
MTKREIMTQIQAEGIDPCEVSLSAVSAYRVAFYEKSGHTITFLEAVKEIYGRDRNKSGRWLKKEMKVECRECKI